MTIKIKKGEVKILLDFYKNIVEYLNCDLERECVDYIQRELYIEGDNSKGNNEKYKSLKRFVGNMFDDIMPSDDERHTLLKFKIIDCISDIKELNQKGNQKDFEEFMKFDDSECSINDVKPLINNNDVLIRTIYEKETLVGKIEPHSCDPSFYFYRDIRIEIDIFKGLNKGEIVNLYETSFMLYEREYMERGKTENLALKTTAKRIDYVLALDK